MKVRLIVMALSVCAAMSARAQFFSAESFGGAALGGLFGALVTGGNDACTGAAIGAGAGFVMGSLVHAGRESSARENYKGPYAPGYGPYIYAAPTVELAPAVETRQAVTPPIEASPPRRISAMSEANALFGR